MTQSNAPDTGFLFIADFVEISGKVNPFSVTGNLGAQCLNFRRSRAITLLILEVGRMLTKHCALRLARIVPRDARPA
jgi:hypothetical protein